MKVLSPTDFSHTSVNACEWIVKYLDSIGGGTVELIHSVNIRSRAGMFLEMDKVFIDRAKADMKILVEKLSKISDKVEFSTFVAVEDPKAYLAYYANENDFDLIVIGTKGLTALKEMTVGSVTAYLIDNSDIPVLAIPPEKSFFKIKSVVIGVDDKLVEDEKIVAPLITLVKTFNAKLHMVHVRKRGDSIWEYDPGLDIYFSGLNYEYKSLEYDDSVAETLTEYAEDIDADILVMIHRKRNWLQRLFSRSNTKEELFEIEQPLLVLPG